MSLLNEIKNKNLVEIKVKNKIVLDKKQADILEKLDKEFDIKLEEMIAYVFDKANLQKIYNTIKKEQKMKEEEKNQSNISDNSGVNYAR